MPLPPRRRSRSCRHRRRQRQLQRPPTTAIKTSNKPPRPAANNQLAPINKGKGEAVAEADVADGADAPATQDAVDAADAPRAAVYSQYSYALHTTTYSARCAMHTNRLQTIGRGTELKCSNN